MEIGTNRQKDSSSPYKCGLRLMHDLLLASIQAELVYETWQSMSLMQNDLQIRFSTQLSLKIFVELLDHLGKENPSGRVRLAP